MSTNNQSSLHDAKSTLLKDLVKNSPKKYTAVIVSDSEDENEKKAILVPQKSSKQQFDTPKKTSPVRVCPKCSKILSDSSELSEEEEKPKKRHHHHSKKSHSKTGSPVIIVSPTKLSASKAKSIVKQAQVEAMLQRNAEKVAKRQEEERRRMEEEALAKARAQLELERKERVKKILEEAKRKKEKKNSYVTVYYTPEESSSDSDDDYYSSESYESEEESFDEIQKELGKLQGIASKIEKAGKKIKSMVNTSLSPEKLSPKKRHH